MSWNDPARVELLKKLWADGLSCSLIASRLGGVTRNAVIGKLYRMRLTGRSTPTLRKPMRPRARRYHGKPSAAHPWNPVRRLKAELSVPRPEPFVEPSRRQPILVRKDDGRLHANDELTNECCRWPCGEVGEPEFGFCGAARIPGLSYCASHARVAYPALQPSPPPAAEQSAPVLEREMGAAA